jgi:hypothetical protein
LTSSDLQVSGNDGFIWIEVTKLSPYPTADNGSFSYREFPPSKKNLTPVEYFRKANNLQPISSTLRRTSEELAQGLLQLKSHQAAIAKWSILGGIAVFISLVALLESTYSLVRDTHQYIGDSKRQIQDELQKSTAAELASQKAQIDDMSKRIKLLESQPKPVLPNTSNRGGKG